MKTTNQTSLEYILSMKQMQCSLAFHVAAGQLWQQFQKASADWFRAKVNLTIVCSHPDYSYAPKSWKNRALLMNLMQFGMIQLAIYNRQQHSGQDHYLP